LALYNIFLVKYYGAMKELTTLILTLFTTLALANSLQGTVTYKDKKAQGVLFIFAKKFDGSMPMPLAVKRVENPTFPYKFELSEKDKMIQSLPFKGPFKVFARLSKSGNVMDKSGPQAQTVKSLDLGAKNILLEIK